MINNILTCTPIYMLEAYTKVNCLLDYESFDLSFKMEPGSHSLPFRILLTKETLPAPFKTQFGMLQYRVAAFRRHDMCYVSLVQQTVLFKGYLK